jgi:hypothetical protein
MSDFETSVFLNCPFDKDYKPFFNTIIFTVHRAGFILRSALEGMDSSTVRMDKILNLIGDSRYSIHDLSRIELKGSDELLPRFNMPMELGCAIGCKKFGNKKQKTHEYIILVTRADQYKKFISDISRQDPIPHSNDPKEAMKAARDWLATKMTGRVLPSPSVLWDDFIEFQAWLPSACSAYGLDVEQLTFLDYRFMVDTYFQFQRNS